MNTRTSLTIAVVTGVLLAALSPLWAADAPAPPWQKLYTGADATGPEVIGLWQFQPGQELKDSSGHKHDLTLRGEAKVVAEGPLGGALESFRAGTDFDKVQGAVAKDTDDLSPAGAFTLEAWFTTKPEMDKQDNVFLIDKKYITYARPSPDAHWDYCLYLARTGVNKRRLMAGLGFGTSSENLSGPELDCTPGKWTHVAFTYDGAGRCRFFVDGKLTNKMVIEGRGPVTPGRYDLTIGDRFGSTQTGFPGYVAQVRLCNGLVPYFTGGLTISAGTGRTVFVRMEKNVTVPLVLENDTPGTLTGGRVQVAFGGARRTIQLPNLAPNQQFSLPVPVDTTLRPGDYALKVTATAAAAGGKALDVSKEVPITVVPRPLPNVMPVVMWGFGDIPNLKAIGFTHELIGLVDENLVWKAGQPTKAFSSWGVQERGELLDDLLRNGLHATVYTHPGTWVMGDKTRAEQYDRVDRAGQKRGHDNVCGNFPEIRQFCYNVGASIAQTFGHYPALNSSLIHSEVRDASDLCFHEHDKQAYKQATGLDIPDEVMGKNGISYNRVKNFPSNRVIPDNDRLLTFYKWFWKNGDGWNPLHSEIHRGLKSTGRKDLWTFFDPAVRVPDVWGSGGDVDIVSQWTYSYPDPIKIGQATDELFAMAAGRPGQQVMTMTQIIWYRSQTAPKPLDDPAKVAQWEKDQPTGEFPTIAPDHMREAFWSKISRPVRGIMYHGWGSLVDTGATRGYVFTNPDTAKVLTELTRDVVRPLGPTLLQVPDRPADVAVLESFSSQIFAGRGSYGWSQSWEADVHLMLQWAHLQPRIVFDETVMRDGLGAYKVLVMPFCDVLTQGVVQRIKEFQRRGGIVVGDEFLCPAIVPDLVLPTYKRTGKAEVDKAALQERAAKLRQELDPFYTRYGDAASPEVVLRFRQYGDSDYLFVLNDKRTFGTYVGQHGRVMEKGLPVSDTLTVRRPAAYVYDLVAHRAVPVKAQGGQLRIAANLGPGDGKLLLLTSRKIAAVKLQAPAKAQRGRSVAVSVAVVDSKGQPLSAVVPVQVELLDPQGRAAEFSGYYGAKDGKASVQFSLAGNDPTGTWTVRVRDLASGLTAQRKLVVGR